jgi:hypothetical protein
MNLYDMAQPHDPTLVLGADVIGNPLLPGRLGSLASWVLPAKTRIRATKRAMDGHLYRGFEMSNRSSVLLRAPFRWYPLKLLPPQTGWQAAVLSARAPFASLVPVEIGERPPRPAADRSY